MSEALTTAVTHKIPKRTIFKSFKDLSLSEKWQSYARQKREEQQKRFGKSFNGPRKQKA